MTTSLMTLATMRAVLRQGGMLDRFSLLLLAAAIALLGVAEAPPLIQLSYGLSVLAGMLQRYWAFRVGLDADLLDGVIAQLAHRGGSEDAAAQQLDAALHAVGLVATPPSPRDWSARWNGMRRLLRWQLLSVAVQTLALVAALALRVWR
ncbi:hypothetical protein JWH11_08830 [Xanthomonas melonis]|uniref:Transmembrane protein n=1 Tax=Xanthomonas melonis TaxID=56456 RepID=A0ABS8NTZ2_9XANT|nr:MULTISPECIES: hypothetical protein [Xanthomonas]MCC4588369.1 hypothetical protein [Xanthomonas sp. NCPPB 1067]MCD0258326.1 hypothetical protein [Xanthomonas melonis]MCD0266542.1 hypothetical protein [Xanthomonas melonis]